MGLLVFLVSLYLVCVGVGVATKILIQRPSIAALEVNLLQAKTWHTLGECTGSFETVTVRGEMYTKRRCFVMALELDPTLFATWDSLGRTMLRGDTVWVGGVPHTQDLCFQKSLRERTDTRSL